MSPMMANRRKADGQPSCVANIGVKAIERTEPALKQPYKMDMARPLFSAGTHLQSATTLCNPVQCSNHSNWHLHASESRHCGVMAMTCCIQHMRKYPQPRSRLFCVGRPYVCALHCIEPQIRRLRPTCSNPGQEPAHEWPSRQPNQYGSSKA